MAKQYVLWGWTGRWTGVSQPLRIELGSLRNCRAGERQFRSDYPDALAGIYESGDDPRGLALQVQQRIGTVDPT